VSDPTSRFSGAPTYTRGFDDDASPIELYRPRVAGVPAAVLTHVVQAGDRLDLLAWRYFGDPLQYWRIVDANPTLRPEELLETGRVLSIPRGG
jgi:nucleoid-associated protein YgaU